LILHTIAIYYNTVYINKYKILQSYSENSIKTSYGFAIKSSYTK